MQECGLCIVGVDDLIEEREREEREVEKKRTPYKSNFRSKLPGVSGAGKASGGRGAGSK